MATQARLAPPALVEIARFAHKRDTAPRREQLEWDALAQRFLRHTVRVRKDGPAWSPAAYPDGATRADASVIELTALAYEFDGVAPDWALLDGVAFLAYSTHSHLRVTEHNPTGGPCWRLVLRLRWPVPREDWRRVWRRARARYAPASDPSCSDASRLYYTPACPPEAKDQAQAHQGAGEAVDPDALPETPEEVQEREVAAALKGRAATPPADNDVVVRTGDDGESVGDRFARETSWGQLLEPRGWRSPGEQGGREVWNRPGRTDDRDARSANATRDGNLWVWTPNAPPFEANTSYTKLYAYVLLEHGGDWRAGIRALAARYAPPAAPPGRVELGPERSNGHAPHVPPPPDTPPDAPAAPPAPGRLGIDVTEIDLLTVTAQAWEALLRPNRATPRLFRQGTQLVRVEADDHGRPLLRELTPDRLCNELTAVAAFYRVSEKATRAVVPPKPVVLDVLATPDPPLPVVERLTECPAFAPDGALQTGTGYHPATRTYCTGEVAGLDDVPTVPTPQHVEYALALFDDVLTDFPFVDQADRANALALGLLPYARDLIAGETPLHGVEAPTPGSGKGLLIEALLRPPCGRTYTSLTQRGDDAEWRKAITAALRDGPPAVVIDNVTQHLTSGALASALTKGSWSDRLLGSNTTLRLPARCVWVASANNPTYSTELARRTVPVRLDPQRDRPWERQDFRHPRLLEWVGQHRADLVWAGLVLVRHWLAQGRPPYTARTLGSFEAWAATMGGILQAAGVEGFLGNLGRFYEVADLETTIWRAFVARWWEQHGDKEVGVAALFALAQDADSGLDLGAGNERSQRTRFGKQLGKQRDRVIGGYRVVQAGERRRLAQWRLLDTRPGGGPASEPEGERG